jgi:deazaflavin-dependent oxidoreductase (nitroreductase family)
MEARVTRGEEVDRWLYRGGHPNRLARLLNRWWASLSTKGWAPTRLVTLEVVGRRSGKVISFPMVVADLAGERYLVAMLGQEANWVANVRAAGGRAVLSHGGREEVLLREVPVGDRAVVLRRYLACAPGARAHIPVAPNAPLEAFSHIAAQYPVFRVTPDPGSP